MSDPKDVIERLKYDAYDKCDMYFKTVQVSVTDLYALFNHIEDLELDAKRFRWGCKNACWIRHEHEAYVAIPVELKSDLSCYAMRVDAVDKAMSTNDSMNKE